MGSQSFHTTSRGKSAQDAYNRAVEDANNEYGHQQGYSGEINSSAGYRDVTEKYKTSGLSLREYINRRIDQLSKFDGAECICIKKPVENKNKTKTQVQNLATAGTKKWVTKYFVITPDGVLSTHLMKADAVAAARKYTEKYLSTTTVELRKVLEGTDSTVARITYKKALNESEGEYVFYGWASC